MKTLILVTASSFAILGGGAALAQPLAQNAVGASGGLPVVQVDMRGGRKARRGGRGAMMRILRAADTNGDRALTQAELDAYVDAQVQAADTNGDGNITLAEFDTVWQEFTRRNKARAFQRLDRDASGEITAEERAETFGGIVARLDRNDDGKLDRADRRGRREGRRERRDR